MNKREIKIRGPQKILQREKLYLASKQAAHGTARHANGKNAKPGTWDASRVGAGLMWAVECNLIIKNLEPKPNRRKGMQPPRKCTNRTRHQQLHSVLATPQLFILLFGPGLAESDQRNVNNSEQFSVHES